MTKTKKPSRPKQPAAKAVAANKKSEVLAVAYEMADDLYRIGVIDKKTFDEIETLIESRTARSPAKAADKPVKRKLEPLLPYFTEDLRDKIKRWLDSGEPTPLDIEISGARGRKRLVRIEVKDPEESMTHVIDAWHRAERGEPPEQPVHRICFPNIETLLRELDESAKMHRCPGIIFASGASGRRARVAGTEVEVWEIIAQYKSMGDDRKRLRRAFHWLTPTQIKAALAYYAAYPAEIDEHIRRNEQCTADNPDLPSALIKDILAAKESGEFEPFTPKEPPAGQDKSHKCEIPPDDPVAGKKELEAIFSKHRGVKIDKVSEE